ncbi:MAG: hypothetical protein AB8B79_09780 [Granulosicoccus sp.]
MTFIPSKYKRFICEILISGFSLLALIACSSGPLPESLSAPAPANTDAVLAQNESDASLLSNLTDDALIPPAAPQLQVSAIPGNLLLNWSTPEGTDEITLYSYDLTTQVEQTVDVDIDPLSTELLLPSKTHLRAWHREQFRLEFCANNKCTSSQRVTINGLASQTITQIKPAVFIENERYAQDIAINDTASVLAISRPTQGSVDIYIQPDQQWLLTQQINFSGLDLSLTRQIYLTTSANADIIAALLIDPAKEQDTQIRILQRLGEAWLETAQLTPAHNNPDASNLATLQSEDHSSLSDRVSLQLSANGNRLLARIDNAVSTFSYGSTGWSADQELTNTASVDIDTANPSLNELLIDTSDGMQLLDINGSALLDRLFTLHEKNDQLWLTHWQQLSEADVWQQSQTVLVSGLRPSHDVQIKSDESGNRIIIAGWELSSMDTHTPVMWRYQVTLPDTNFLPEQNLPGLLLSVVDSLRLAPTPGLFLPSLKFAGSKNLNMIAIGWQSPVSTRVGDLQDASLLTYRYHEESRRWLTALELPEAIPTLAKRSFAGNVVVSADARTLLLSAQSSASGQSYKLSNGLLLLQ